MLERQVKDEGGRMRRATPALALLALAACGGGGSPTGMSPASPTPSTQGDGWPAGTTVQLVDGATGHSIPGPLAVAGATVPSGAPLASAAAVGATVDVSLPGFLNRQTLVRTGETRLVLWPDTAALPGDYTRALVYTASAVTPGAEILESMRRLATRVRTVAVLPSSDLQGDPDAMDAHRSAIDGLNAASTPAGVTYRLGGSGDLNVPTRVDPSASTCADRTTRAFTSLFMSNSSEITRAEIVFCFNSVSATTGTVAHEIGHTFGLRHSLDPHDLMYPFAQSSRSEVPTSRETLTMSLMRARRSGTVWPDNDRDSSSAAGQRVVIVVD
jgi:hypothetical protein